MSVRFKGPLSLEQQREINRQVGAYLRNSPAESPQRRRRSVVGGVHLDGSGH